MDSKKGRPSGRNSEVEGLLEDLSDVDRENAKLRAAQDSAWYWKHWFDTCVKFKNQPLRTLRKNAPLYSTEKCDFRWLRRLEQEINRQEIEECTFTPVLKHHSQDPEDCMFARAAALQHTLSRRRLEALNASLFQKHEEMQQCTFHPQVNHEVFFRDALERGRNIVHNGEERFISLQTKAREMRSSKESKKGYRRRPYATSLNEEEHHPHSHAASHPVPRGGNTKFSEELARREAAISMEEKKLKTILGDMLGSTDESGVQKKPHGRGSTSIETAPQLFIHRSSKKSASYDTANPKQERKIGWNISPKIQGSDGGTINSSISTPVGDKTPKINPGDLPRRISFASSRKSGSPRVGGGHTTKSPGAGADKIRGVTSRPRAIFFEKTRSSSGSLFTSKHNSDGRAFNPPERRGL